jgi:hypothetical protein
LGATMADDKDGPFGKTAAGESAADPGAGEKTDAAPLAAAQDPDEGPAAFERGAAGAAEATVASPAPGPQKLKQPSRAPGWAAALIIGALSGFGGAYALRYVDALQGPDPIDHIAELNARTDALEHNGEASLSALAALENRLAADEGAAAKARAAADAALSDLRKTLAARPVAAAGGGQAEAPDLRPIEDKIDALEKKLGSLDAVQQKVGQIDAVQQKLGQLEASFATPKVDAKTEQERALADQRAKALSAAHSQGVVATSLVQLVSRGEPFANEVAALANLGVDPAKLAPLQAAANTGVASISDLSDQFAALAPSLEAPEAPAPDTSILERLARDASNLVRIRRAGDPHETDLPGRIAAIEGALGRLDVAKAYAAWLQLPDAARAKSANWGAAAKARLDAMSAASAIEADAVTALGKVKS